LHGIWLPQCLFLDWFIIPSSSEISFHIVSDIYHAVCPELNRYAPTWTPSAPLTMNRMANDECSIDLTRHGSRYSKDHHTTTIPLSRRTSFECRTLVHELNGLHTFRIHNQGITRAMQYMDMPTKLCRDANPTKGHSI
jgi:hypothetical protein